MSKYILKFSKEGLIRYISHLDMMRSFQRAFKRAGIQLAYSQGYNPHPRMSFAQPLPLGYTSAGEYLEFETKEAHDASRIAAMLSETLPQGISVLDCRPLTELKKSLASLVCWGSYEIIRKENFDGLELQTNDFMGQERILIEKKGKTGRRIELDIKPLISEFRAIEREGSPAFYALIRAGSEAYLNPEHLMQAFFAYLCLPFEKSDLAVRRLELYDSAMTSLLDL